MTGSFLYTSNMLSSKFRFHGHGSLRFVYSRGQVVRSKYFVMKHTVNHRRTEPRVAVVVSKKVIKSAVARNRIRRRLYEAIRIELPNISQQTDLVFIVVSAEVLSSPAEDIRSSLSKALASAGLYKHA